METLEQIYQKHKKGDWPDKGSVHSYIEVYEDLLKPYRNGENLILEIGLMNGESLRMWEDYFSGVVFGIDCSETPLNGLADLRPMINEKKHNIIIMDAANKEQLKREFGELKFDVVIEDANHNIEQQIEIYSAIKPFMNKGGIYIIEDVQSIEIAKEIIEKVKFSPAAAIIDRRHVKGRYDDILIIIYF